MAIAANKVWQVVGNTYLDQLFFFWFLVFVFSIFPFFSFFSFNLAPQDSGGIVSYWLSLNEE